MNNKTKKVLFAIILTIILLLCTNNITKAKSTMPLYLGIGIRNDYSGKVLNTRDSGYGYMQDGKKVWKINTYDSLRGNTADTKTNLIYCIKAGAGLGSNAGQNINNNEIKIYSQRFDLRDRYSIESPYDTGLPNDEVQYNKLMWVLDNIYTDIGKNDEKSRKDFLVNVFKNFGSQENAEFYAAFLNDDDIDVVQQLVIWYFTNPLSNDEYHYEDINLKINATINQDSDYKSIEDIYEKDQGKNKQTALRMLYQYFKQIGDKKGGYKAQDIENRSPIILEKENATMLSDGKSYVAGPYKIEQVSNVDFLMNVVYKNLRNR